MSFAVAGYSMLQQLHLLEHRVFGFEPDAALVIGHTHDLDKPVRHLARLVTEGREIPYPELRQILAQAGVEGGQARTAVERRLAPDRRRILGTGSSTV